MKLDRTDRRILQLMQSNGRISNLELADAVGLSPTPCSRRVKRLEESGIIDKHVTLLDQSQLIYRLHQSTRTPSLTVPELWSFRKCQRDLG